MVESLLLGFALAADAVSVCIACAVRTEWVSQRQAVSMALAFGFFQGGMPIIGWFAGAAISTYVAAFGPWVAAVVFLALAAKMIRDGWTGENDARDWPGIIEMLTLAIATSIDALVVGATLPATATPIGIAASTIGIVTTACCGLALYAGRQLGERAGPRASLIGGVILVLLAIRALFWA